MIPPSFLYPWLDRDERDESPVRDPLPRRPWPARGRAVHLLAFVLVLGTMLAA